MLLRLILCIVIISILRVENVFSDEYTGYQESSTDNCTGTVSLCTEELPFNISNPPDVWLDAKVSVASIELNVDNIFAHLNLNIKVASLVNISAGVDVSISNVNLKILGVEAQVQLAVKFDKIVEIVNRTLDAIDLNPILASVLKGVQNTVDNVL